MTYGINPFPKNSPSHCKLEAYLPPYGWVSSTCPRRRTSSTRSRRTPTLTTRKRTNSSRRRRLVSARLPRQHLVSADEGDRLRPGAAGRQTARRGADDLRGSGRRRLARPRPGQPQADRLRLDDDAQLHARPRRTSDPFQGPASRDAAVNGLSGDASTTRETPTWNRFVSSSSAAFSAPARPRHGPTRPPLSRQGAHRVGLVTNDQAQTSWTPTACGRRASRSKKSPAPVSAASSTTCRKVGRLRPANGPTSSSPSRSEAAPTCRHGRPAAPRPLRRPLRGRPVSRPLQAGQGFASSATRRNSGFSPKAAYIFRKQLEEADAHRPQPHRRVVARRSQVELTELMQKNFRARRCCRCRRRRARASTR